MPLGDDSLSLLRKGYGWLPDLRRRSGGNTVHVRLLGRPAVGLVGEPAARFFYDEDHIHRAGAIPSPVQSTLFGHGAVHTLDGDAHRVRKQWFLAELAPQRVDPLVSETMRAWDVAAAGWPARRRIVLHEEASRILTRGVCAWAGVPVEQADVAPLAADLVALVDGFATAGPRHWRARASRRRREKWLAGLVRDVRAGGTAGVPERSVIRTIAQHRDADGALLDPPTAAVEVLNVIRPTVAVSWFVAFAGHALQRWPEHRDRLRAADAEFAEAFAQEVRRFYPFAPFVGGLAARDLTWDGDQIPQGSMVLLDLYGQNHHRDLWDEPYSFRPERFVGRPIGQFDLVPQGGGDPSTGHRCPGEPAVVALLAALSQRLAELDYTLPEQDLRIPLRRIPALPASRVVLDVTHRTPARTTG